MKHRFSIYRNDTRVDEQIPATKRAMLEWIRDRAVIGTHMREIYKTPYGYRYCTTVGVEYKFIRVRV